MMLRLRYAWGAVRDLSMYTVRTGRWWMPLLIVSLALTAALVTVAKVVVPTVVYTLF